MSSISRLPIVTEGPRSRRRKKQNEVKFNSLRRVPNRSYSANARRSPKQFIKFLGIPPISPLRSPDASNSAELGRASTDHHHSVNTLNHAYSSPVAIKTKVHHYSSREVAEELCIIDAELLRKIQPEELENGAWMKNDLKHRLSPNVLTMVHASNELAMLVPGEILSETSPQGMAKAISIFIKLERASTRRLQAKCEEQIEGREAHQWEKRLSGKSGMEGESGESVVKAYMPLPLLRRILSFRNTKIASKCYAMYNFNSLKAVLAGLQCTPIFRLKRSWKEVPAKRKKKFELLSKLMSEESNYRDYRHKLNETLAENIPCIPFLGVLLTTIVQQDSAHSYRRSLRTRRKLSGVEDYTIIEAITVRNRLKRLLDQSSLSVSLNQPNSCNHIKGSSHAGGEKNVHVDTPPEVSALILDEMGVSSKYITFQSSVSNEVRCHEKLEPSDLQGPPKSDTPEREYLHSLSSISTTSDPSDILETEWANTSFRKRSRAINPGIKRPFTRSRGSTQNFLPHRDREHDKNKPKRSLSDSPINLISTTSLADAEGLNSDVIQKFSHVLALGDLSDSSEEVVEHGGEGSSREARSQAGIKFRLIRESVTKNISLDQIIPTDVAGGVVNAAVTSTMDPGAGNSSKMASNDIKFSNSSSKCVKSFDACPTGMSLSASVRNDPLPPRRMDRRISDQNFDAPANKLSASIHSSCSAECITDILKIDPFNPMNEQDPIDKTISDALSSSLSSDEGIGVSDYGHRDSGFSAFKEHDSLLFSYTNLDFVGLSRAHSSSPLVADSKKGNPKPNQSRSSRSIDRHILCQKHQDRASFLSEMAKFYGQQEKTQKELEKEHTGDEEIEDIPETGPKTRRSRRRASCVLCFAQATIGKGSWPSILFRYQVSSLGRSNPCTSCRKLRTLITEYPRNSEAQYYKLSYEREPQ